MSRSENLSCQIEGSDVLNCLALAIMKYLLGIILDIWRHKGKNS